MKYEEFTYWLKLCGRLTLGVKLYYRDQSDEINGMTIFSLEFVRLMLFPYKNLVVTAVVELIL